MRRGADKAGLLALQDAHRALQKLHDLPLRGRNLVVTFASQVRHTLPSHSLLDLI